MIIGNGIDLIDIRRIKKTLDRFGVRFINRIYTEKEILKSENKLKRTESYAKRFAVKEACAKALGTGFRDGVFWRDIFFFKGSAQRRRKGTSPMRCFDIHLSPTASFEDERSCWRVRFR